MDGSPMWMQVLWWIGGGALLVLAIYTFVKAPGKKQDPGRKGP